MIRFTKEQDAALLRIREFIKADDQDFMYLGGYAGTGKTTLMQYFINSLDEKPICLAPTGKAASVLAKKLDNCEVRTIHSALYKPLGKNSGRLEELKELLKTTPADDPRYKKIQQEWAREVIKYQRAEVRFEDNEEKSIQAGNLIIVDEASMVTTRMMDDLLKTKAKIIFVGDPGQLPPVKDSGYFTYTKPDAMLTEVQRQALDNPIIALSMKVRQGQTVEDHDNEHVSKRPMKSFDIERLRDADQILTGMNAKRHKVNRMMRKMLGQFEEGPQQWMPREGEKLISLRNRHSRGAFFINGVICSCEKSAEIDSTGEVKMDVSYEDSLYFGVPFNPYPFEVTYNKMADPMAVLDRHTTEFDFGYAITVHKSQGSEWEKVILVDDEMMLNNREQRKRWLYTALTRAKSHLTWLHPR
jgi:exodeoxyribonuclease-5